MGVQIQGAEWSYFLIHASANCFGGRYILSYIAKEILKIRLHSYIIKIFQILWKYVSFYI